jgi:hypothetical protein
MGFRGSKVKEPSSKYVWRSVGRYVLSVEVKDSSRDKLAHVSFYLCVFCVALTTWMSATGWAAVVNFMGHFSLLDNFDASLLPYVIGFVGAALAIWYFIGGYSIGAIFCNFLFYNLHYKSIGFHSLVNEKMTRSDCIYRRNVMRILTSVAGRGRSVTHCTST